MCIRVRGTFVVHTAKRNYFTASSFMKPAVVLLACCALFSACEMPLFVTHTKKKDGYRQLVCTELLCRHKRMMEKQGTHMAEAKPETADTAGVAQAPVEIPEPTIPVTEATATPTPVFPDAVALNIEPMVSSNLLFRLGKAELRTEKVESLDTLAQFLTRNPQYRLGIYGHTDSTGSDEINRALSAARAHTVAAYIINGGVASERIEYHGYGSSQPIASNTTAEGREKNRRVEFIVNP